MPHLWPVSATNVVENTLKEEKETGEGLSLSNPVALTHILQFKEEDRKSGKENEEFVKKVGREPGTFSRKPSDRSPQKLANE